MRASAAARFTPTDTPVQSPMCKIQQRKCVKWNRSRWGEVGGRVSKSTEQAVMPFLSLGWWPQNYKRQLVQLFVCQAVKWMEQRKLLLLFFWELSWSQEATRTNHMHQHPTSEASGFFCPVQLVGNTTLRANKCLIMGLEVGWPAVNEASLWQTGLIQLPL